MWNITYRAFQRAFVVVVIVVSVHGFIFPKLRYLFKHVMQDGNNAQGCLKRQILSFQPHNLIYFESISDLLCCVCVSCLALFTPLFLSLPSSTFTQIKWLINIFVLENWSVLAPAPTTCVCVLASLCPLVLSFYPFYLLECFCCFVWF